MDKTLTVDENGAVTAAGGLLRLVTAELFPAQTMDGTFFNMDDNGIMMGLTADDGQTPGTTVQVTNNGVLFTDGKSEMGTTINGNTIHTGSITATGTSTLGDVKIGEGLVDGVDVSELDTTVGELDKNAVKWDDADQDSIHGVGLEEGGHLTATTISAKNGHFTVDEAGLTMTRSNGQDVFTVDENGAVTAAGGLFKISDGGAVSGKTMNGTFFNMDDNGIMMGLTADDGQTPGTTVQVTNNGVLFTDGKSEMGTTINGNTIHTGSITATGTSTLGDVKIGEGLVDGVDVSELDTTVGELDKNAVKWDDENQDSIHGVGLENGKVTADSASIGNILMNNDQILIDGTTSLSKDGLVMNDGNGNSVYLGGGQLMVSGNIQAGSGTIGNVKIANGLVDGVDVSELAGNVSALDQNAVKWDDENHNSINGVGLADGNVTADKVTTGKLDVNGNADISGDLSVDGSLTVGGETVATGADVTDIKKQIGVNEDGSYKTIENGAKRCNYWHQ